MSQSTNSQKNSKSSSSRRSVCPPTALSPSPITASVLTDPNQIPTALENSVNTARGATASEMEHASGLSDTSAGSGRSTTPQEDMNTARAPTSPEILMNDLRRGSLFGRQTKSQKTSEPPQSVTNITFSNNTSSNMRTAQSAETSSVKAGNPPLSRLTSSSAQRTENGTLSSRSSTSRSKKHPGCGVMETNMIKNWKKLDESAKSTKSKKTLPKKNGIPGTIKTGSEKNGKNSKVEVRTLPYIPRKEPKSIKPENHLADRSVYFPSYDNPVPLMPPHEWQNTAPPQKDSTVYDVSKLTESQRGMPPKQPKSLFGGPKNAIPVQPKEKPTGNKIVIFGQTPDGKTRVQMTIDMQIVAGAALGGANGPVELKPKKILVAGKEYDVDSKRTN